MDHYMSPTDIQKVNDGESGHRVFLKLDRCNEVTGETCVLISKPDGTFWNLKTHKLVNGVFEEDATLVQQEADKKTAKDTEKQNRKDRKGRIKAGVTAIEAANTVADLKPILKDLVDEVKGLPE